MYMVQMYFKNALIKFLAFHLFVNSTYEILNQEDNNLRGNVDCWQLLNDSTMKNTND